MTKRNASLGSVNLLGFNFMQYFDITINGLNGMIFKLNREYKKPTDTFIERRTPREGISITSIEKQTNDEQEKEK